MNTTYLRFPSQEVWEQAAAAVGVRVNNPTLVEEESVDPDTGDVITPPTPMDGWHVNYKAATLPSDLEAYVVTPNSPHRKFAGD